MVSDRPGPFVRSIGDSLLTAMGSLLLIALTAGPFLWMVSTSLKSPEEVGRPHWIPKRPTAASYQTVLARENLPRYFANSLAAAAATTAVSLVLAASAAYALSRRRFAGRKTFLYAVLLAQMVPSVVLLTPLVLLARETGILPASRDSVFVCYGMLVFLYSTFVLPFTLWMMKAFFDTIPRALDECAMVDGCTPLGAFVRVILPLSLPGLAASSVFAFLAAWNEYLFALTFINTTRFQTLPLALWSFMGRHTTDWGSIMAASTLFSLPAIAFFAAVQKRMTLGMTAGAVKE